MTTADDYSEKRYEFELLLTNLRGILETTAQVSIKLFACRTSFLTEDGLCVDAAIDEETPLCLMLFVNLPMRDPHLCEDVAEEIRLLSLLNFGDIPFSEEELQNIEDIALSLGFPGLEPIFEAKELELLAM